MATAPVANDDILDFDEGGTIEIQVADLIANDDYSGDRSLLTVNAVRGDTDIGVAGLQDRYIEYQLPVDYFGTFDLIYTITDGTLEDEGVVRINVNNVNDAPIGSPDQFKVQAGTTLTTLADRSILRNDEQRIGEGEIWETDTLTAVLDQDVSNGTLNLNADGSFTYTPDSGFTGTDFFTYFVNDGQVNSDQSVRVDIQVPTDTTNQAPVATDDSYTGTEDETKIIKSADVLSNDTDQDSGPNPIQLDRVFGAVGGRVSLEDANIFFYPDADFNGIASFVYVVSDEGLTDRGIVEIDFTPVNDAPVTNDEPEPFLDRYAAYAGDTLQVVASEGVLFNDRDVDGDDLTARVDTGPANGALNFRADGSFAYTPDAGFTGRDEFTYFANDGTTDSASTRVVINVSDQGSDGGNGTSLEPIDGGGSGGGDTGGSTGGDSGGSSDGGATGDPSTGTVGEWTSGASATSGSDRYKGGTADETVSGGAGDDILKGGRGDDTLKGGAGEDDLKGNAGNDRLEGLDGGTFAKDMMNGGSGKDVYLVNGDIETMMSDEVIEATNNVGNDKARVWGTFFEDTHDNIEVIKIDNRAERDADGFVHVYAGDTNTRINGSDGADAIATGIGRNTITPGKGDDFVKFQSGAADTFIFRTGDGTDTLSGFNARNDKIDLSAMGLTVSGQDLIDQMEEEPFGLSSELDLGGGDVLIFANRSISDLSADMFIL